MLVPVGESKVDIRDFLKRAPHYSMRINRTDVFESENAYNAITGRLKEMKTRVENGEGVSGSQLVARCMNYMSYIGRVFSETTGLEGFENLVLDLESFCSEDSANSDIFDRVITGTFMGCHFPKDFSKMYDVKVSLVGNDQLISLNLYDVKA